MNLVKSKILVVEDESIVAADIADTLKHLEYEISDTVSSGKKALLSVAKTKPDLILMDIVLKGDMSGIETTERINAFMDVPVIFLTAYSDKTTLAKTKSVAPFGYIVKPFKEKDLNSAIQVALEKHRQIREIKHKEETYKGSLNNLGEAVICIDEMGMIYFINQAAEKLTGFKENILLGSPIQEICFMKKEGDDDPISKVIETGTPVNLESNLILGKEKYFSAHVNVTAVRDSKDNIIGAVLVLYQANGAVLAENQQKMGKAKLTNVLEEEGNNPHTINLCTWCKKIFNKRVNRWDSIEMYFKELKLNVEFSHCMCSVCANKLGLSEPNQS